MTLVGFDGVPQTILSHIGAADVNCILAFRVTEIVEFAMNLSEKSKADVTDVAPRSAGFSFNGLFGGTSKSTNVATSSNKQNEPSSGIDHARVAAVSSAVIPLKLKFAMMIADFGLTNESAEYVLFLKKVTCKQNELTLCPRIDTSLTATNVAQNKSKKEEPRTSRSFSPKFLHDLEEFCDRLTSRSESKLRNYA